MQTLIDELSHPFGLAVDETYVYWTDWNNYNIKRANKKADRGREVLVEGLERLMDVKIFSRDRPRGNNMKEDEKEQAGYRLKVLKDES